MNGVHTIDAVDYHADQIDSQRPSLSASIAHILVAQSPKHAWTAHPRLNPDFERVDEQKFDRGTIAHSLLLDQSREVAIIEANDWRTKAAKEDRDEARAGGKIPLLWEQWRDVEAMVRAVREQVETFDAQPPLLADGKPEQTIVWEEDGVVCRARLDWLRDDFYAIDDLKTSGRSVRREQFSRNLYGLGYDLKAAFYLRAVRSLNTNLETAFRWINVETSPPYAVSVVQATPELLTVGEAKVEFAISLWRECMALDFWPAYETSVVPADPPPAWEMQRWLQAEIDAMEVPW